MAELSADLTGSGFPFTMPKIKVQTTGPIKAADVSRKTAWVESRLFVFS
jgi:hypothetical protein